MSAFFVTRRKRVVVEVEEVVFLNNCEDAIEARKRALIGEGELLRDSETVIDRRGRERILTALDVIEA
jgi:hypothetical protein